MLSGMLTGKQTNPNLAVLRKLAKALGVNVERLLE
jgi:transcriptional regulator with XRE-family HTH domain